MSEQQTGLVQFHELPAIAANAPAILEKNAKRLALVISKGQELLDTIEGEGMTTEIDAACNEYMANVARLKTMANELRSPVTQMLTAISKEFTSQENQMDKDKPDTIPYKIQQHRNELARQILIEQQRKQQELLNKQKAQTEKVELTAKIQLIVREKYNSVLFAYKKKYNDLFNTLVLDNIPDVTDALNKIPEVYPLSKFNEIAVPVTALYIPTAELPGLIYDTRAELYPECSENFKTEMSALKHHLLDQIPARKQELMDMEKADKAEKKRLQDAAMLRQREEELRLDKENAEKEKQAAAASELTVEVGAAQIAFEKDMTQAEIFNDNPQTVKHQYVIKVLSKIGWQQIAALWFKEIAKNVPHDKMEKKTLAMMKKDLETLAFAGGERLADSGHLQYCEDVKALTKKV